MATKTTDQIISDLTDREAIRDTVVRYYDAVWRDDIPGLVDTFADDGTLVLNGQKIAGRADLLKFYRESITARNPRPFCHNHIIDLRGNGRATGRCYTELRNGNDFGWIGAGIYDDEYVKIGDKWKFRSRTVTAPQIDQLPKN